MLVFLEGGKLEYLTKNPCCKARTNSKLNPHMVPRWNRAWVILVGDERSHYWPCLLPRGMVLIKLCFLIPMFMVKLYFYTNREITTIWYYVNSRRHIHVDSEKIRVPERIWIHDPPWSSRMLYHWATGDYVVSKGQIVGIDWNRIAWLHRIVCSSQKI